MSVGINIIQRKDDVQMKRRSANQAHQHAVLRTPENMPDDEKKQPV